MAALGIGLAVSAFAQEDVAPAAESESAPANESAPTAGRPAAGGGPVEEIVVTAQRREELLQDVPISMSVYNQEQLNERNVVNAADLANYTPSLTANRMFGDDSSSFAIRGFVQELRTTPSVGVYFADVVAPRGGGSITAGDGAGPGSFFDLENVQVLKGPQGTLFGRNTTGGAVLLVPRRPTDELGGYVESSIGNFNMTRVQAVVNAPVYDKWNVRVRVGVDRQTRDGYLNNTSGIGPSDLSNVGYTAVRASMVMNPLEQLENYSIFSYLDSENHGGIDQVFACNSEGVATLPVFVPYCEQQLARQGGDFYEVKSGFPDPKSTIRQWQFINTTTWEVTDYLTIKNIIAPANLETNLEVGQFGSDFQVPTTPGSTIPLYFSTAGTVPGIPTNSQNSFVEELRFQGQAFNDRLEWQGGFYYEKSDHDGLSGSQSANYLSCDLRTLGTDPADFRCNDILGTDTAGFFLAAVSRSLGTVDYDNKAVYGQATYQLLPDVLRLTGGIRYTRDETSGTSTQTVYMFPHSSQGGYAPPLRNEDGSVGRCVASSATFPDCTLDLNQDSDAPTWLIGLDWNPIQDSPPIDDSLLYAKWTRGYRQGSVNIFGVEGLNTFDPEHVDTYEIGAKMTFEGPVPGTFSIAGFYNDFRDQQIQIGVLPISFVPTTAIVNAGSSRIWGIETEANVEPVDRVRLSVAYTYLNTKLETFNPPELPGSVLVAVPSATEGDPLPYSPQNQLSLTASYRLPFVPERAGDVTAAATYIYTDNQQAVTPSASPFHTIPSYDLLNLNLSWDRIMDSSFDASFFATNVLGEEYWTFVGGLYNAAGFEARVVGQPTMFGARLRYNFSL